MDDAGAQTDSVFHHRLTPNRIGHFVVTAELGGNPVEMLVDTGGASTVVDVAWCRDHNIPLVDTGQLGGGAGGVAMPIFALGEVELTLNGIALRSAGIYAIDMSHVNQGLEMRGATRVAGVIGADVLRLQKAVIDYAAEELLLRH